MTKRYASFAVGSDNDNNGGGNDNGDQPKETGGKFRHLLFSHDGRKC